MQGCQAACAGCGRRRGSDSGSDDMLGMGGGHGGGGGGSVGQGGQGGGSGGKGASLCIGTGAGAAASSRTSPCLSLPPGQLPVGQGRKFFLCDCPTNCFEPDTLWTLIASIRTGPLAPSGPFLKKLARGPACGWSRMVRVMGLRTRPRGMSRDLSFWGRRGSWRCGVQPPAQPAWDGASSRSWRVACGFCPECVWFLP